ncbi:membrane-bound alpha-1,6- mannosyltransferase Initiation-specific [Physocladia obscura]|uniref:Membrane-bound alpha-1,6- mannosyltransferase Initiation-specific n=1 Tax=Physocladia obscura TaxID=109957 RepID=A0AAD5XEX1_9FUNG|nr:membrane-bound alpha-1,6- mannosyltransferase Initiation-specific [Physocladia obscura]
MRLTLILCLLTVIGLCSLSINTFLTYREESIRLERVENDKLLPPEPPSPNIPHAILQTYKTSHIDEWKKEEGKNNRTSWFLSWGQQNPNYTHIVLDDLAAIEFMTAEFTRRIANAYIKLPLKVERADMLRYAMALKWGGIYTDSDTFCHRPIDKWVGEYKNASFIVAVEVSLLAIFFKDSSAKFERFRYTQLVQWTFAAAQNHPILRNLLIQLTRSIELTPSFHLPQAVVVEKLSGPQFFTSVIETYLKAHGESLNRLNKDDTQRVYFEKSGVLVLPLNSFSVGNETMDMDTAFVSHYFKGFDMQTGWKNGNGKIKEATESSTKAKKKKIH